MILGSEFEWFGTISIINISGSCDNRGAIEIALNVMVCDCCRPVPVRLILCVAGWPLSPLSFSTALSRSLSRSRLGELTVFLAANIWSVTW